MADRDININLNADASGLEPGKKGLDDLGNSAEKATTSVGGMRKELRATTEVTSALGESLGESSKSMAAIGEGGRLAYAGIELMNGGLIELGATLLSNPLFLIAAAIAGIVAEMIHLHKEREQEIKDLAKDNEEQEKYLKSIDKQILAINKQIRAEKVKSGEMKKIDADREDEAEETAAKIEELAQNAAKRKTALLDEIDKQDQKIADARKDDDIDAENEAIKQKSVFQEELWAIDKKTNQVARKIGEEASDKEAADQKEADDKDKKDKEKKLKEVIADRKKNAEKRLKDLKDQNKLLLLKTKEGTQERVDAIADGLNSENGFYAENYKDLQLTLEEKKVLQLTNAQTIQNAQDKFDVEAKKKQDKIDKDKLKAILDIQVQTEQSNEKVLNSEVKTDQDIIKSLEEKQKKEKLGFQEEAKLIAARKKLTDDEYAASIAQIDAKTDKETEEVLLSEKTEAEKEAAIVKINSDATDQINAASDLRKQHQKDNNQEEKDDWKKKVEEELSYTKQGADDAMSIADAILDNEKNNSKASKAAKEKAAKEEFEINKAAQLINVAINTISNVVKDGGPETLPGAFDIVTGVAAAIAIASKQFNSSASSGSSAVSFPSSGGSNQPTAPQFFGLGGGTSQNSQTQQTQKVIVTESDITKAQNKVSNINSYRTISLK